MSFYKLNKSFNFSLGKRMIRLAEPGFKANDFHKNFIIMIPDRSPVRIPFYYDRFHVVGKNGFRDSHVLESMEHSDEKILLLRIRKELYESLATVMTNHRKTCSTDDISVF